MQHSSAQAAFLPGQPWLFDWQGAATLAPIGAGFRHHGHVCVVVDRSARDLPAPLASERAAARASADAEGFLIRRALARALAGAVLDVVPATLVVACDARGAPVLEGGHALHLSFSARGDAALVALGTTPLGADLETHLPPAGIPWQVLREDERAALRQLPAAAQDAEFLSLWRAKEATLKAAGLGFRLGPEAVIRENSHARLANPVFCVHLLEDRNRGVTLGVSFCEQMPLT